MEKENFDINEKVDEFLTKMSYKTSKDLLTELLKPNRIELITKKQILDNIYTLSLNRRNENKYIENTKFFYEDDDILCLCLFDENNFLKRIYVTDERISRDLFNVEETLIKGYNKALLSVICIEENFEKYDFLKEFKKEYNNFYCIYVYRFKELYKDKNVYTFLEVNKCILDEIENENEKIKMGFINKMIPYIFNEEKEINEDTLKLVLGSMFDTIRVIDENLDFIEGNRYSKLFFEGLKMIKKEFEKRNYYKENLQKEILFILDDWIDSLEEFDEMRQFYD